MPESPESKSVREEAVDKKVTESRSNALGLFLMELATKEDFQDAKNLFQDSFLQDTQQVRKVDSAIRLKTKRGWNPYVVFTDTLLDTDDDAIREYQYLGQYKELDKYLVSGSFWEHFECYAVDKETGQITTFWNCPTISPDKKMLANLSMAYGLEGVPNGIQVWKVEHEYQNQQGPIAISKFIEIDQQVWAPDDFVWKSPSSIILQVFSIETFWEKQGDLTEDDFQYLRLKFN
ncbi:hypothetical protein SAMN05444128_0031 [Pontibacter indicus]|uniref:Uncharacterized protein n=1 Tax=Pontibacter indicus TaxID=1317125 RepID=A0A1R3W7D8_9BACT|nr:hypothetical protein SAMN05444128_0031 [Pontibacter indicus]